MDGWIQTLMPTDLPPSLGGAEYALLILLVAFCIGHVIAWTYMLTHTGLSYSQMFCASLLVMPVLVALTMMLLAGNILIALGLLSIFAMIRFRNVLKDTRDTTFILWAVVEGVSAGTGRLGVGVLGGVAVAAVFLYARATSFGSRHRYDVVVSVQWSGNGSTAVLKDVFRRHTVRAQLASQHDIDAQRVDLSYRLLLRDPSRARELVSELQSTTGVERVALFHRSDEAEV
jgi:Domain of unknown function (DUF4956)